MNASLLETLERRLPVFLAILSAIVYAFTLAPSISHTDSGELAAVCYTAGVAHPTGYPLFSMLGWLWTRIAIVEPALQLNIMCMLFVAAGVYLFSRTLKMIFSGWNTRIKSLEDDGKSRVLTAHILSNAVSTLALAFTPTFWMQSTSLEVYSLHILLVAAVLFFLLRAWKSRAEDRKPWLYLAVVLALAFSNHLSVFVVLPAIAWLFFQKMGFGKAAWIRLGSMLAIFFPLLTLFYLWLPLVAGGNPQFNWGDPQSWDAFWHHVSGKQFRVWMFTGMEDFSTDFKAFLARTPGEFMYAGILLAGLGLYYGTKMRKNLTIALGGLILLNLIYACNYHIKDIEPYFLPTSFALAIWMALGIRFLWVKATLPNGLRNPLAVVLAVWVVGTMGLNWTKVSQHGAWQYEDYAREALESLPENAIVVSRNWDVFVSPAYYLQSVKGVRPDVRVLEYQMMHDRHWYPQHMRRNFPKLSAKIKKELDTWDPAVDEFDLHDNPDPVTLSRGFMALFYGVLEEALGGDVFLGPEMYPNTMKRDQLPMPDQVTLVPDKFFMRMIPANSVAGYYPTAEGTDRVRFPRWDQESESEMLKNAWADVMVQRAIYELVFSKKETAKDLVNKVRKLLPDRPLPSTLGGL